MNRQLLDEICRWKREAKLEDTGRYFYHTPEIARILNGEKCYVIGRKGTGKTAISEFLVSMAEPKRFAEQLSFKNFPFNDLYGLQNARFTPPNQYITLWKWLIYCHVAKMMMRNENVDGRLRTQLGHLFSQDAAKSLARSVARYTDPEFRLSFLGVELAAKANRTRQWNDTSYIERCDLLEEVIAAYADDSSYYIVFDELDEDYRNLGDSAHLANYASLITGLFKAVQDVKATFRSSPPMILPVVFLRDDIFEEIRDPDKTKWGDLRVDLRWDRDAIRNLLGFRIGRARDEHSREMTWAAASDILFKDYKGTIVARSRPLADWLSSFTLARPRDYISFIKIAAEKALATQFPFINAGALVGALQPYSEQLRTDIEDEMGVAVPEIRDVFDTIARIGQPIFSVEAFETALHNTRIERNLPDRPAVEVLGMLFRFGVIGNSTPAGVIASRLRSSTVQFDPTRSIVLLRGLHRALNIADPQGRGLSGKVSYP